MVYNRLLLATGQRLSRKIQQSPPLGLPLYADCQNRTKVDAIAPTLELKIHLTVERKHYKIGTGEIR